MQLQRYTDHSRDLEIVAIVVGHHRVLVIPEDSGVLDWLGRECIQDIEYFPYATTTQQLEDVFVFELPSSDDVPEFLEALKHQLRVLDYELDSNTASPDLSPFTCAQFGTEE